MPLILGAEGMGAWELVVMRRVQLGGWGSDSRLWQSPAVGLGQVTSLSEPQLPPL